MFLARIGNRRSRVVCSVVQLVALATFLAPLRLAWAAEAAPPAARAGTLPGEQARRSSERIRPTAITDLSGRYSAATLWRLFDGDAATALDAGEPVKLRLSFAAPVSVDAIGGYSGAAGVLALLGVDGAGDGTDSVAFAGTGQQRWARAAVKKTPAGRTFTVEWRPAKPGAPLAELEVWGRAGGSAATSAADPTALTDALAAGIPEGAESFAAARSDQRISAATPQQDRDFLISVPVPARSIDRAFLVYELDGLPHFTAARRAINGGPAVGGFGVSLGAQGGVQVEEISAATLREGRNVVRFEPSPAQDPVGYRVSALKLVVTHTAPGAARSAGTELDDGRESTGWSGKADSARRWHFAGVSQPHDLEFRLVSKAAGNLVVRADNPGDAHQIQIDLAGLKPGWHQVSLDSLPATDGLSLALAAGREDIPFISELRITGSPIPGTGPGIRVTYPLHGECVNHQVHVRGLAVAAGAELRANGERLSGVETSEASAFSFTASEKALGGTAGKPFSFKIEAIQRSGEVARTEVAVAGCVDRVAVAASRAGAAAQPKEDLGAPYGAVVHPGEATTLAFGGATLEIPAGAVDADVRITIRPLSPGQVPVLDTGMTNLTAGGRAFRLGPREMVFKKPVSLSLPVDRARIDPSDPARSFYFDEVQETWHEVPSRLAGGVVLAETTHFTDFIAATLVVPEHPGLQSLNPTSIKDLKVGDPTAGMQLIAPPQPNSQGTANLDFPIEVPPGRRGMQPNLSITYDSSSANSWLGVGWNLRTSSIEIDTRFGVPKYDGSERFLIDGQAITLASAAPSGAPSDPSSTWYVRRNEGRFDWIQQIFAGTQDYYWLVTDKQGTKYTYGQSNQARHAPLSGGNPVHIKTFRWMLEKVEDIYGNQVTYTYFRDTGNTGPGGVGGDNFVQLYPLRIDYTKTSSNHSHPLASIYSVNFILLTPVRLDAFSTGRPGFLELTRKLLQRIEIRNGTSVIRQYSMFYAAGDFGKQVLKTIDVYGKGPTATSFRHSFDYYQTPRDAGSNPRIFAAPTKYTKLWANSTTGLTRTSHRRSSHGGCILERWPWPRGRGQEQRRSRSKAIRRGYQRRRATRFDADPRERRQPAEDLGFADHQRGFQPDVHGDLSRFQQ